MQSPTAAPAPPGIQAPPAAPGTPAPFRMPVPQNARDIAAIRNQRSELSSQLINVRDRRTELAKQYENASGANRDGLAAQLRVLDQRIVQIESELKVTGEQLASSQAGSIGVPPPPGRSPRFDRGPMTAFSIVFTLFVLAPMAIAAARLMWRRASRPTVPPAWSDATTRFDRLEQAVDAIAIEMERVSEGQRFMTRIMTERAGGTSAAPAESTPALNGQGQPLPALGAGSPEQILVPKSEQEALRVRRS